MTQNTSIYWKSEETARRARWMAKAEDLSVSQFVSALINERYDDLYPEPPIRATCPTCGESTEFFFLAYWEELGPDTKLYQCSDCGSTKTGKAIKQFNNGQHEQADEKEKMEAIS